MFQEMMLASSGGGGGTSAPETATFTIAYGTPVVLNFNNPHTEFIADLSKSQATITKFIISDGIKGINSGLTNWMNANTASDNGGYEWSSDNKTLTLTMPRNYYAGTYNLIAM